MFFFFFSFFLWGGGAVGGWVCVTLSRLVSENWLNELHVDRSILAHFAAYYL